MQMITGVMVGATLCRRVVDMESSVDVVGYVSRV